jgi:hypothetical protein
MCCGEHFANFARELGSGIGAICRNFTKGGWGCVLNLLEGGYVGIEWVFGRRSEVRGQRSEVGGRGSGVRGSEVRG